MGEKEGKKHQCVVATHMAPTEDLAHNPGMCPDWESSWQPFGSQPTLNPLSHTSQGGSYYFLIYLLIWEREREEGEERQRNIYVREKHQLFASYTCPDRGSNPQPRYAPWLIVKPTIFWCTGLCSNQLTHLASARRGHSPQLYRELLPSYNPDSFQNTYTHAT